MRKWIIRILIFLSASFVGLVAVAAFDGWYQNNYKSVIQVLEVPAHNSQFVLLTDIAGFGDRAWYVYQLPIGSNITKEMKSAHSVEGVLFWNYSEAGDHGDNEKIEIFKERYLVFSRGGYHHSLYDLRGGSVLVNEESPWNAFQSSQQHVKYGEQPPPGETGSGMDVWVRINLHEQILKIIDGGA